MGFFAKTRWVCIASDEARQRWSTPVTYARKQELFTTNETICFKTVRFKQPRKSVDEPEGAHLLPPLTNGRMLVTTERLLFVCMDETVNNDIDRMKPSGKTGYRVNYLVDTNFKRKSFYFPVDIKDIVHAHFRTMVRIQNRQCPLVVAMIYPASHRVDSWIRWTNSRHVTLIIMQFRMISNIYVPYICTAGDIKM